MTLTPEQFNMLVTKDDLRIEFRKFETKIDRKLDKILTAVDNVTMKHESFFYFDTNSNGDIISV